jgi:SAM-dependent methyltransferase
LSDRAVTRGEELENPQTHTDADQEQGAPPDDLVAEVVELRRQVAALQAQLDAVYASNTWKAGRMLARPKQAVQRAVAQADVGGKVSGTKRAVSRRLSNESPELYRYHELNKVSDDKWLAAILASLDGRYPLGPLPGFPEEARQAGFVGGSGEHTMREAFGFYQFMKAQCAANGVELGEQTEILDFGVGWGRFARLFLHDVPSTGLTLADPWDLALQICTDTGVPGKQVLLGHMPPSDLPSATYDLAFAYSVFSHLSPKAHLAWKDEFARVVKPGGLAIVTTQGGWFLDFCEHLRNHPELHTSGWHEMLSQSFGDLDESRAAYAAGEFLYSPNGGGPSLPGEFYGDAIVPRQFFETQWSPEFELVNWVAEPTRFEQAAAVLRRR